MLKKFFSIATVAVFFFLSCEAVYAAANDPVAGMIHKFRRGVVDLFTGWAEFPVQIGKGYNEGFMGDADQKIAGAALGILEGLCHSMGRTFSGAKDIMTFWTANPEHNEGIGIPLDGEYAWDSGEPHDLFYPTFTESTLAPIGEKFRRGLADVMLGFVEVPGQMIEGSKEGALDLGIVEGVWFWWSREINGFFDIITTFLPGHVDEKGMPYDEKWPWDTFKDAIN